MIETLSRSQRSESRKIPEIGSTPTQKKIKSPTDQDFQNELMQLGGLVQIPPPLEVKLGKESIQTLEAPTSGVDGPRGHELKIASPDGNEPGMKEIDILFTEKNPYEFSVNEKNGKLKQNLPESSKEIDEEGSSVSSLSGKMSGKAGNRELGSRPQEDTSVSFPIKEDLPTLSNVQKDETSKEDKKTFKKDLVLNGQGGPDSKLPSNRQVDQKTSLIGEDKAKSESLKKSFQNLPQSSPSLASLFSSLGLDESHFEIKDDPAFKNTKSLTESSSQKIDSQDNLKTSLSGGEFLKTLSSVRLGEALASPEHTASQQIQTENGISLQGNVPLKNKKLQIDKHALESSSTEGSPLISPGLNPQGANKASQTLVAHVVPGAMSRDRLSTDSLIGMSTQIRSLSGQGAGEIRVRLKPDHLGELSLRVSTVGNQVSLQIQASDEKAKKIIEESMSYLKESLSAQSLTLGQVDLSVGNTSQTQNENNSGSDPHRSHGSGFQETFGQNSNGDQQGRSYFGAESREFSNSSFNPARISGSEATLGMRTASSLGNKATSTGRIDVKA